MDSVRLSRTFVRSGMFEEVEGITSQLFYDPSTHKLINYQKLLQQWELEPPRSWRRPVDL